VVGELPKVFDDAFKKLFRANAQDFVSLIQKNWRVEELLPTELDTEHIYADGLARCRDEAGAAQLAHFEYQRDADEYIGERMLEYSVKASRANDYLPVFSCVINLKGGKKAPRPPLVKRLNNGQVTTIFYYASIDLGEITVEELLAMDLPGLLPLLPLTDGGNRHEAVDIMIERLLAADKTDLLWVGYTLAAKVFSNDKDLQWLKGRFALMNDFLWDSPIYQEIVGEVMAQGIETGKMEALSQTRMNFLKFVHMRFPALEKLAHLCASNIDDNDELLNLMIMIGMAQTEEEARAELQSHLDK
jgi:predicted transposase YdaD